MAAETQDKGVSALNHYLEVYISLLQSGTPTLGFEWARNECLLQEASDSWGFTCYSS